MTIPREYQAARIADFKPGDWRGNLPMTPGMVFIFGPVGCGKTHLLAAILTDWAGGGDVVSAEALLSELQAGYDRRSPRTAEEVATEYSTLPVLGIDDLGAERPNDAAWSAMLRIIDARKSALLPTVITSNILPDKFDPRMADRFRQFHQIGMTGKSRRTGPEQLKPKPVAIPVSPFIGQAKWWLGLPHHHRLAVKAAWRKHGCDPWGVPARLIDAQTMVDVAGWENRCAFAYACALNAAKTAKVSVDAWLEGA
jgi:hypothetical protein